MIQKLEISGVHVELTDDIKKYVTKKIGKLDKYLPQHARESVHAEVYLKESKAQAKKRNTCEVVLYLPKEKLICKESTMNMFAAVDIVEAKLKNQITKYKELHGVPKIRLHRRVLKRLHRQEA